MAETTIHTPGPNPVVRPNPSRLRLALVMLVAIYPIITALLYIILPLTEGWQTWQRTLILAPLMVFAIVFVVAPNIQKHLGWFIGRLPRPVRG